MSKIPPDILSDIEECLQLHDPITSQTLMSYSFSAVDDWKLGHWKALFNYTAVAINDFIATGKEVQSVVNSILRKHGALHVLPPGIPYVAFEHLLSLVNWISASLSDITQALTNNRSLLTKESVLPRVFQSWDESGNAIEAFKKQNMKGPPNAVIMNGGLMKWTTSTISLIGSTLFSPFINLPSFDHQPSETYLVKPERRLPFEEPYTITGISLDKEIIVVEALEKLINDFLFHVRSGSLKQNNILANDGTSDVAIIPFPCILPFLEGRIRRPVTSHHVEIFVWFLTFFSTTLCRPFECTLEFDNQTDRAVTKFRAIKISLDHSRNDNSILQINETDRAALLERFAEDMITEKIKELEQRIVTAEEECKKQLKLKNQESALRWLKRKKLNEQQFDSLQQQLLRIDEARQMRDASQSIGLVASVVQATVKATKQSIDGQKVADLIEDFQQSKEEIFEVQDALGQIAVADMVSSESLEEEYNRLMAREVDDVLSGLGEVPSHPLPVLPSAINPKERIEESIT